jgi:flavodoxin
MKALVVYESFFGNTEKIAQSIAKAFIDSQTGSIIRLNDIQQDQREGVDLLIVGAPTRAFQPTQETKNFIKKIPGENWRELERAEEWGRKIKSLIH